MAGTQRKTKQKQAIYDALAALDHPTATQVYERVHEEHPTVSRGTVFRVLGGFAERGHELAYASGVGVHALRDTVAGQGTGRI